MNALFECVLNFHFCFRICLPIGLRCGFCCVHFVSSFSADHSQIAHSMDGFGAALESHFRIAFCATSKAMSIQSIAGLLPFVESAIGTTDHLLIVGNFVVLLDVTSQKWTNAGATFFIFASRTILFPITNAVLSNAKFFWAITEDRILARA